MPFPIAAAIGAGAALATTGINAVTQGAANRKNREFAEKQYQVQKQDNLEFWRMNNDYNSPQAQMKRFQEAGLNPNLIYGSGGANYTSSTPSTPQKASYDHKATSVDIQSPVQGYFDAQIKSAQLDNLKAQNNVLLEEALLKKVTRDNISFDVGLKGKLENYNIASKIHQTNKLGAESDLKTSESRILHNLENLNYETAAEKLTSIRLGNAKTSADTDRIRQGIINLKKSGELQQLELEQRSKGISQSDPIYFRVLGRLLQKYGITE